MLQNVSDGAFARAVQQAGVVSYDQLEAAKAAQAESAAKGVPVSLADMLVQQGVMTPAIRENIEKKVRAQQQGGIQQFGQFKLLKKLGEGGMGAVYLAEDTNAGRQVAIKLLPKKHAADAEFVNRFRREARAAGQLNHVNIAGAHTVGEEMGYHYLVMEYVEGEPLDKTLKGGGALKWDKALEIVIQVARGLSHAHEHGIVHRDIKPGNIIVTPKGVAKILDLGLSKTIGGDEQTFHTQTGVAVGTPHYLSPEQARGDKSIDGRTDIYSLGATFYHLVTGQTPFQGSTAAVIMTKHLNEQLPNPQDIVADIPDGVAHVITRTMAKEPKDRYRDCKELLADLELVIDGKTPASQAVAVGKSSVAMRLPSRERKGAVPLVHARGPETAAQGTRKHEHEAQRGKLHYGATAGQVRRGAPVGTYLAIGVAALGALVFILALNSGGSRDREEREARAAAEKQKADEEARLAEEQRRAEEARLAVQAAAKKKAEEAAKMQAVAAPVATTDLLPTLTLDLGGGVKMELVPIPAGKFVMGSPDNDPDREGDGREGPQHEVTITRPFYMGKYEVTVAQFRRFAETAKYQTDCERGGNKGWASDNGWRVLSNVNWKTPNLPQENNHPVCLISWNDAQAFVSWAAKATGRTVRLPTEAEWEYACRAKTTTRFYLGQEDKDLDQAGWFAGNSGGKTHPVGQKAANAWGLYDMHGNLWEWCEDRYQKDYYKVAPRADPLGPTVGGEHVLRGGSWHSGCKEHRSAWRFCAPPDGRGTDLGFRVVVSCTVSAEEAPPVQPETKVAQPGTKTTQPDTTVADERAGSAKPPIPPPFADVAAYAKEHGLEPAMSLDLGKGVKMEFVLIPAGKFLMGSPRTERGEGIDQGPQHEVTISKPFYMGRYEVTQVQYEAVTGANPSKFKGPKNPVETVSWYDAQEFCKRLSAKAGKTVQLSTEAQWEYACRAGTKTRFYSGDGDGDFDSAGWSLSNSGQRTHPVGEKKPNAWGLYDMHGNVWEWCADWYGRYKAGAATDPKGPATGGYRVLRGGAWYVSLGVCRSAGRYVSSPDDRGVDLGFRLVLECGSSRTEAPIQPPAPVQKPEIAALPKEAALDLGGGVKMELVLVKAGEFNMGAEDGGGEEKPIHKVKISQPFYIGKYDVTVAQFRAFADAMKFRTEAEKQNKGATVKDGKWQEVSGVHWRNPGFKQEDNHPAVVVTWNDAQEFCRWATKLVGRTVHLPTEAEWEYAARGPSSPKYPWGDKLEGIMANVADASLRRAGFNMQWGEIKEDDGFPFTSPGAAFKNASWCGAYDMAGNVWQWCQDNWSDKYYADSPTVDPPGPATGGDRVLRGGGWSHELGRCRSAHRIGNPSGLRFANCGFRVVVECGSSRTEVPVQPAAPGRVIVREGMGYAVKKLEIGTSSHTNDNRPWQNIPQELIGKKFTQVVAYSETPLTLEFPAQTRVWALLMKTHPDLYAPNLVVAEQFGSKEKGVLVNAANEEFEVWSILGRAGQKIVFPKQMGVVAEDIELVPKQANCNRRAAA